MPKSSSSSNDLTNSNYWNHVWRQEKGGLDFLGIVRMLRFQSARKTLDMFSRLVNEIKLEEADIFEIGCAPGTMLLLLKEMKPNYRLNGLDYAEEGVEIAKNRFKTLGINAEIYVGDVREFPNHYKYDIVTSHGLVEHFEDPTEIINHHKRFVKPGGYVLITLPNYTNRLVKYLIKRFDPHALKTHNLAVMNQEKLFSIMSSLGFKEIKVGCDGGPRLRAIVVNKGLPSRLYLFISRVWNFSVSFLPRGLGWQSTIWITGQLPYDD